MRPIEVTAATPADMEALVTLCLGARAENAVGSQVCTDDSATLAQQLGALTAAPGGTVLVARSEGDVVGLLLGRVLGPNPFTDEVSLAVEAVYVAPTHRRRGVGHALMLGATVAAEAAGAGHVYASPIPGARGMQRFFVQLGFTPAASHRVSTTAALHRRLVAEPATGPARRTGARHLEDLIARRRQSRLATGDRAVVAPAVKDQALRASISTHVRRAVQIRRDAESSTTIS